MGDGERRVDKKELDGARDRDARSEAGKEQATVGRMEEEGTNDESRHSHRKI